MKRKDIRLYNVMFPIWFFFIWPSFLWLLILPANFLIDSLVVWLSARRQGLGEKAVWKKHILPVWFIGFFSDVVGAGLIFLVYMVLCEIPSMPNLIRFPWTTLISIPGVILSGVLIYFLNRRFAFGKSGLDPAAVHRLCLHLAIFTAPYAVLIPIYG